MVFTVAMILFTAKFFKSSGDLMQMLMLFGCLLFPVVQPIAIYLKAKVQAKTMPKDVNLSFDDAGLHVTVGKEKESIGWNFIHLQKKRSQQLIKKYRLAIAAKRIKKQDGTTA